MISAGVVVVWGAAGVAVWFAVSTWRLDREMRELRMELLEAAAKLKEAQTVAPQDPWVYRLAEWARWQ